ncbi:MAG: hypothetical protein QOH15_3195, partial [Gaiellales bacterium]|nr:hypothetical protein [Gaiellales bacterium]
KLSRLIQTGLCVVLSVAKLTPGQEHATVRITTGGNRGG